MAMLRARSRPAQLRSAADTGGLMQSHAPTIYAYSSVEALLQGETRGGAKVPLPGHSGTMNAAVTERPGR
jgi:hypothetical protein